MHFIWLILAFICIIYYGICATYAGAGSSFIFVWLILAAFFAIIFEIRWMTIKGIMNVPVAVTRLIIGMIAAGGIFFAAIEGLIISDMVKEPDNNCEYIIVLGCQVRGTRITKSLRKRLDKTIEYMHEVQADDMTDKSDINADKSGINNEDSIFNNENNKAEKEGNKITKNIKIIVSGGQGNGEDISEAQAMYDYLVQNGIPADIIIKEDKSTNTEENFRFSEKFIEEKSAKIGIVTNNFHIYRAKKLAHAKGLDNITGIPASSDNVLFINYMVRESIGIVKDYLCGNFHK